LINTGFLSEAVNLPLLLITVLSIAGIFFFILQKVIAARRQPYAAGEESMVGHGGTVRESLNPDGMVFVDGALWQAAATGGSVPAGTQVPVLGLDRLRLRVEPVQHQQTPLA